MIRPADKDSSLNALLAFFAERGLNRVDPPILQPASVFLELSGEDIRRRLYLVQDPSGRELCLRPDYTIPVSLDHLAGPAADKAAGYSYLGPVFRYRPQQGTPGEFAQAGIELYGIEDRDHADAEIIALSLDAVSRFGLSDPEIRLGDPGLFMAFVAALGLPEPWPRRLRAAFGRPGGLAEVLSGKPAPLAADDKRHAFLAGLARTDPEAARAAVEEMVAVAGIAPIGGRSPQEIAERLLEQAEIAGGRGLDETARDVLTRVAAVRGEPETALKEFTEIADGAGLDVNENLVGLARRFLTMVERGVSLDRVTFSAEFGRRLDYYTGFVFEIYDPAHREAGQVIGGGRYDKLLSLLGAPREIPAVGCAIWIDRLVGEEPA
ncbi:ATP phosphoribosyltransferase regulatory subunit [Microbaculum sp. FT89]|uniref:ATP phosphoribosyltransferase regulatory subunit n=1 Tax=Microbaculum sp. FT89 TaxID=3447298 RepID=UPI003F52DA37